MSHRILLSAEQYPEKPPLEAGNALLLNESDSHYLNNVLRARIGTSVLLVEPIQRIVAQAEITTLARLIEVTIRSTEAAPCYRSPVTNLLYPLTKGDTVDWVLEKGCELGLDRFILWQADRSVIKIENERDQQKKLIRWEKIIRSAAQQSEKLVAPEVLFAPTLKHAISLLGEQSQPGTLIQCTLGSGFKTLSDHITKGVKYNIVVGPEGDFSPAENVLIEKRHDLVRISLGPFRLRAETAAITAVALVCGISGFSLTYESS